jgi:hypothetical protein
MRAILLSVLLISITVKANGLEIAKYQKLNEDAKSFFIGGVASGILFSMVVYEIEGKDTLFCMPSDINLGGDLARVGLSNFDGDDSSPVALGVIIGLRKMFPC